jgi:hypothetical protein
MPKRGWNILILVVKLFVLKLKQHTALILLLGFFIALTPRSWWHDCDSHHDIEISGKVHVEKDNCFVCDFDLGELEQPFHFQFNFNTAFNSFSLLKDVYSFNSSLSGFSHRGPPNFV